MSEREGRSRSALTRSATAAAVVVGVGVAAYVGWADHQQDVKAREGYRGRARTYCSQFPAAPPSIGTAYLRSRTFQECVEGRIDELVSTDGAQ